MSLRGGHASRPPSQIEDKLPVLTQYGYKALRTLGNGTYATVKEAFSERHRRKIAIKIISKRRAPDDFLKKFLPREMEALRLLRHPNLITCYQAIESNTRVYLMMELATNGDLLTRIKKYGSVHEPQAGLWFHQLTEGLDYCHEKGVVHRDLKCENLLIDHQENLKISDFGFARTDMKPNYLGKTPISHTYCGSFAYAAPEILTGTPYEPTKADIWSSGVILFTMVFGRLPFDDTDHKRLLNEVQQPVLFPNNPDVPEDCRVLLDKILTKAKHRIGLTEIRKQAWFIRVTPKSVEQDSDKPNVSGETSLDAYKTKVLASSCDSMDQSCSKIEKETPSKLSISRSRKSVSQMENKTSPYAQRPYSMSSGIRRKSSQRILPDR